MTPEQTAALALFALILAALALLWAGITAFLLNRLANEVRGFLDDELERAINRHARQQAALAEASNLRRDEAGADGKW